MKEKIITLPELAFIGGTRGIIGFGLGLLLAGKLKKDRRRTLGWTLLSVGALSTIPIVARIFSQQRKRVINLKAA